MARFGCGSRCGRRDDLYIRLAAMLRFAMTRATRVLLPLALAACAPRLGPPKVVYGPEPAILPLVHPSTDTRRWYVPVDAGEAGSWVFFVDTGYTHSTCDDGFVEALGVAERGHSRVYGELGSIRTGKAKLPPLQIGDHRVEDLVCQTRDLAATSSICTSATSQSTWSAN